MRDGCALIEVSGTIEIEISTVSKILYIERTICLQWFARCACFFFCLRKTSRSHSSVGVLYYSVFSSRIFAKSISPCERVALLRFLALSDSDIAQEQQTRGNFTHVRRRPRAFLYSAQRKRATSWRTKSGRKGGNKKRLRDGMLRPLENTRE